MTINMDLPVNNVEDSVGDEDIRDNDLGLIDPDSSVLDKNVELLATSSVEGAVLKRRAVADGAGDDMILKNILEIRLAQVGQDGTNIGKGAVARSKDGDVPGAAEVGDQVGLGEGASNGGEVGGDGSVGDVLGDVENAVDDMNDTAGEVEVLKS
jgi:hypothetical protein